MPRRPTIPKSSIRKLLRENFTDGAPLALRGKDSQNWLFDSYFSLREIQRILLWHDGMAKPLVEEDRSEMKIIMFQIEGERDQYDLKFHGETNVLHLFSRRKAFEPKPVSDLAEVKQFCEAIRQRLDRDTLRKKRDAKVHNLKESGMKARLLELAAEHDFSFRIGQSAKFVNLSIRVENMKAGFHLAFPKGKFDAMIEGLPDTIRELKRLHSLGVSFRTNDKSWLIRGKQWISGERDPDE